MISVDSQRLSEWVAAAKAGDEEAFSRILKACHGRLFRVVYQVIPCFQDVEEILQDTYFRFYKVLGKVREEDPFPYLRRIALRRALTHVSRRRGAPLSLDDLPADSVALRVDDRRLPIRTVYEWASSLPPKRRVVFILREVLGFDDAEISDALAISTTTVRRHASLARETFKKNFADT